jgi:ketopantoate reductase
MEPIPGVHPLIILDIVKDDVQKAKGVMNMVWGGNRFQKASMLQDIEKGLPFEIDRINGYLSEVSARVGILTPVNVDATAIITDIQAGK